MERKYKIVRHWKESNRKRTIKRNMTLEEVQAWCRLRRLVRRLRFDEGED